MLDCDSLYFIYTVAISSLVPIVIIPWYFMRKERKMIEDRQIKKKEINNSYRGSDNWKGLYR